MSKTATRTSGLKRKHEEMSTSAAPSPGTPTAAGPSTNPVNGAGWPGQPTGQEQAVYQNGNGYYPNNYGNVVYAMQMAQAQAQAAQAAAAANNAAGRPAKVQQEMDRSSVNQLSDVAHVGGVNIREEEQYAAKRSIPSTYSGVDRTRTQTFIPQEFLVEVFKSVAKQHKLTSFTNDVITLAGLAVEHRIRSLLNAANTASLHRTSPTNEIEGDVSLYADGKTPIWDKKVKREIAKQLMAIEKVEKAEEMRIRRERKERQDAARNNTHGNNAASGTASNAGGDDEEEPPKKKKKKADGPGVTAKNMSEETKKKLSNTVANAAAGFGNRYAWMNTGSTPIPRKPTAGGAAGTSTNRAVTSSGGWAGGNAWGAAALKGRGKKKDDERKVTLGDVLFVVEREKGHGAGRGSARGWS